MDNYNQNYQELLNRMGAVSSHIKLKMLVTRRGTEDGRTTQQYKAGEVYDISRPLAQQFLRDSWAGGKVAEVVQ